MNWNIRVPFKENSINGIVRKINKITKSKNIFRDGFVSLYASSFYTTTGCMDLLLGAEEYDSPEEWFGTGAEDNDPWIIIDFHSFKITIEAVAIYTNPGDYLPYYEILISDDNSTWEKAGDKTFESRPLDNLQNIATTNLKGRFIKLRGKGQRFGNVDMRMVFYSLDVFGVLSGKSLIRQSCKIRKEPRMMNFVLIAMVFS